MLFNGILFALKLCGKGESKVHLFPSLNQHLLNAIERFTLFVNSFFEKRIQLY